MLAGWVLRWGAIVAISAAVGAVVLYVRGAEQAKARNVVLTERLQQSYRDMATNQTAFEDCQSVNQKNIDEAIAQERLAAEAVVRDAVARALADKQVEDIHARANEIRGQDTQCRTLDDALPDAFVAGVRRPDG
jgi:hypothetical protein